MTPEEELIEVTIGIYQSVELQREQVRLTQLEVQELRRYVERAMKALVIVHSWTLVALLYYVYKAVFQ
jgi:hypothetical protein